MVAPSRSKPVTRAPLGCGISPIIACSTRSPAWNGLTQVPAPATSIESSDPSSKNLNRRLEW